MANPFIIFKPLLNSCLIITSTLLIFNTLLSYYQIILDSTITDLNRINSFLEFEQNILLNVLKSKQSYNNSLQLSNNSSFLNRSLFNELVFSKPNFITNNTLYFNPYTSQKPFNGQRLI